MSCIFLKPTGNFLKSVVLSRGSIENLRTISIRSLCSIKEKPNSEDANEESKEMAKDKIELEKELLEKNDILTKQLEDYKDKYQRALADRENVRNRLEKQIRDSKLYGIQSFCKDLLDVADIFRKAIDSVPQDKVDSSPPEISQFYNGVTMTETQLLSVFKRHGLSKIELKEGDKFDPSTQEAMFEVSKSDNSYSPNSVANIMRVGWKLHDRCIRSAQVGVVKE